MKYHSRSVIASGWNGPSAWAIKKQGKEIKTRWATTLLFSTSASFPPPSPLPCCLWDDIQKHHLTQPALNYSMLFEPGRRHAVHSPKIQHDFRCWYVNCINAKGIFLLSQYSFLLKYWAGPYMSILYVRMYVLETHPFCLEHSCVCSPTSIAIKSQLPDLVHVHDTAWVLLACSGHLCM